MQASLGGASLLQLGDLWSVHNAPTAGYNRKTFGVGAWAERRYNVGTFTSGAVAALFPVNEGKAGVAGIGLYQLTNGLDFSSQKVSLSYALRLSEKVAAGAGMHVLRTTFKDSRYGSKISPVPQLGLIYTISEKLQASADLWNPAASTLVRDPQERLPSVYRAGLRVAISPDLSLLGEGEKQTDYPTSAHFGVDYRIKPGIRFMGGINTAPLNYSVGVLLATGKVGVHLAFGYHPMLGSTPSIDLQYGMPTTSPAAKK